MPLIKRKFLKWNKLIIFSFFDAALLDLKGDSARWITLANSMKTRTLSNNISTTITMHTTRMFPQSGIHSSYLSTRPSTEGPPSWSGTMELYQATPIICHLTLQTLVRGFQTRCGKGLNRWSCQFQSSR